MYKFDAMKGARMGEVIKACRKSSIVKTFLSGVCFWAFLHLFDEGAQECAYAKGATSACKSVDKVLHGLQEKGKFNPEDFIKETNCND